jgi:transposase InsO family protein
MPWYGRIHAAVPALARTQAANLALLTSAIIAKRTLCLSELARADAAVLGAHRIAQSLGRPGTCWDNALAERCCATL